MAVRDGNPMVEIPKELYDRLVYLGLIDPSGVRSANVGKSDYSDFFIQAWTFILDHNLDYWDGDIVKRVSRTKAEAGMTMDESRIMDYTKIKHICDEKIRQIRNKPHRDQHDGVGIPNNLP